MRCHLRTLIIVFILLDGLVHISGCHATVTDKSFPEDTSIRYGSNGTPTYIKGSNLSSFLDNDPDFMMLKKKDLYVEISYEFLQGWNKLFKINNPRKEFTAIDVKIDDLNYKHIRFQQVMENIPIWGRELSIHLNGKNQVYLVQGHSEPTLKNVPAVAGISEQTAIHVSKDAVSGGKNGWEVTEITKAIFMVDDRIPRLSYKITLVMGIMGREYYFVDAMDGKILHRITGIHK
jgi:Zn-dependent metalloprotease